MARKNSLIMGFHKESGMKRLIAFALLTLLSACGGGVPLIPLI
jgi:hypothetical protein